MTGVPAAPADANVASAKLAELDPTMAQWEEALTGAVTSGGDHVAVVKWMYADAGIVALR